MSNLTKTDIVKWVARLNMNIHELPMRNSGQSTLDLGVLPIIRVDIFNPSLQGP